MSEADDQPEPAPPADGWADLTVAVLAGGAPIAVIGPAGDAQVPATSGQRTQVLVALSRAIAVLAAQPDPASPEAVAVQVTAHLLDIGTPAALEAADGIQAAVVAQTDALAAATAIILDAAPAADGIH